MAYLIAAERLEETERATRYRYWGQDESLGDGEFSLDRLTGEATLLRPAPGEDAYGFFPRILRKVRQGAAEEGSPPRYAVYSA